MQTDGEYERKGDEMGQEYPQQKGGGTKSQSPLTLWRRASPRPILFYLVVKVNTLLILKTPKKEAT